MSKSIQDPTYIYIYIYTYSHPEKNVLTLIITIVFAGFVLLCLEDELIYLYTYIHTNIQTYIQPSIHTYIQTDIHTYIALPCLAVHYITLHYIAYIHT